MKIPKIEIESIPVASTYSPDPLVYQVPITVKHVDTKYTS
jgi:hypothetical protein